MTSAAQPGPDPAPDRPTTTPAVPTVVPGGSPAERAGALLRVRSFGRLWRAQLLGSVGDRLGLLVLLILVVEAAATGEFGTGYRAVLLAVAAVFGLRVLTTLLLGVLLLQPLARLLDRVDRRWTLFGADVLRAVLFGVAPFWIVWSHSTAAVWLLITLFVAAAAERVAAIARQAVGERLLPATAPGVPAVDQRPVLRHIDQWTGYAAVPLAAAVLAALTLIENGLSSGIGWLDDHTGTVAAFGAAGLLVASAVLLYLQELPSAPGSVAPYSPLTGLRAPTDAAPGAGTPRGRTGTSVLFSFSAAGAAAAIAAAVAVALPHAVDLYAGPVGFGLLVLAATGAPLLGLRIAGSVLPVLGRRRLLPLALGSAGLALLLTGLVRDFVLALVLVTLAGLAAGVAVRTAAVLLDLETEESRRPLVREHLRSMLRVAAGTALVVAPLLGAAIGPQTVDSQSLQFDHGGAGLALSVLGLLLLAFAVVVFFRADDRRGTAPFGRDVWDALRGGSRPVPHRAGTGFFIAVEGGDGAGKSTQAQALAEWIRSKGHEVVITREPGGSAIGQRLRAMLLDVGNTGISHRAEALLYAADRAEHVENVIRPALDRGAVVITDRYMDSSVAYQGAGRDLAASEVARINRWAVDGLVPDLTVLLDVDPATARERFTEALDRLESEPEDFHARVRAGFLALAAADPVRYLVVNAAQAPGAVTTAIRHRLDRELPLSEQERAARIEQERLAREAEAHRIAEEARLKAEAEQAEREKQAQLERLRLAEEEKAKALQAEEDRKAAEQLRLAAEQARLAAEAEAARRRAAEEERREAEAAERRRIESEAARLAELERQRDERRAEERRRAEDALRRTEAARVAAEAAAATAAATAASAASATAASAAEGRPETPPGAEAPTQEVPAVAPTAADGEPEPQDRPATPPAPVTPPAAPPKSAPKAAAKAAPEATPEDAPKVAPDQPTEVISEEDRAEAVRRADAARAAEERAAEDRAAQARAAQARPESAAEKTTVMPKVPAEPVRPPAPKRGRAVTSPTPGSTPTPAPTPAEERTAVLPQVPSVPPATPPSSTAPSAAQQTAPSDQGRRLPRSWRVAKPKSGESVQEGSPDWLFRPEEGTTAARPPQAPQQVPQHPPVERTTEMPIVEQNPPAPPRAAGGRYDWAEETPLDDLPSLTDELLGSRDEWSQWDAGDDETGGKGRKGKR
ncbi:dTMP kinase [Streptacidiphilus sp. N1-12]|uniref:dTMP kinase n=2 Tax=Streptacidiphilus alkalitolerans TaxID=3342712 RepID=A0ABV6WFK3_9ACTN